MLQIALPATRLEFFGPRLAVTAVLLALLLGVARFLWFPGLSFSLTGISVLILTISGVALVVGPGLSTLLYRREKKGLIGDLIIVLAVELVAIGLTAGTLYERRPYFAVFAVDRFELVSASEVNWDEIPYKELLHKPGHAPRLVFAQLPTNPDVLNALIDDTVFAGGPDIDRRPEFWLPYANGVASVIERAKPLQDLAARGGEAARLVRRWIAGQPGDLEDYAYFPVRGTAKDAAIVVHRQIGYPVAMLDIDPW